MAKELFQILNRWSGSLKVEVEIECSPDDLHPIKMRLAVQALIAKAKAEGFYARADLTDADLTDANLTRANLRAFKADFFLTLSSLRASPTEAIHLIRKLQLGQVNGHSYGKPGNECACLIGTIAQPREVDGDKLDHDSSRPAERWFMMINPGDKSGDASGGGFAAKMALEWALDWCECHGVEVPDFELIA